MAWTIQYATTYTPANAYDTPYWQQNTPVHGTNWTGTATFTPAPPSGREVRTVIYAGDGPNKNSMLGWWQFPAGTTTATVVNAYNPIPAGTTVFFLYTFCTTNWWTPLPTYTAVVNINWLDATPPPPCQYGTQPAATAGLVSVVTEALVAAACTAIGAPWLEVLFAPLIGYVLDTGQLCGTGPPPLGTITPQSLLETIEDKLAVLQQAAWYTLCQCTPAPSGSPPPIAYTPPTITQPPGWPPPAAYSCSNSDVCTTLQLILKRLDELSTSQSVSFNQTTNVFPSARSYQYTVGPKTSGIAAPTSLSVSGLVGLRIEVTESIGTVEKPGNPPYLWDQGWCSVSDGGAMLQEIRITRASFEWFPPAIDIATVVGVYPYDGVVVAITELLPKG